MKHTEVHRLAPKQELKQMIAQCKWNQQIWLATDGVTSAYLHSSSEESAKTDFEVRRKYYAGKASDRKKGALPSGDVSGITAKLIY
tara:strand:+ start:29204 stop:29461 length:258 start_codon:yes stop_codon:yes gene_type:complete